MSVCDFTSGPVIPDDRNMLNENLPSPDRPTVQGVKEPGKVGRVSRNDVRLSVRVSRYKVKLAGCRGTRYLRNVLVVDD